MLRFSQSRSPPTVAIYSPDSSSSSEEEMSPQPRPPSAERLPWPSLIGWIVVTQPKPGQSDFPSDSSRANQHLCPGLPFRTVVCLAQREEVLFRAGKTFPVVFGEMRPVFGNRRVEMQGMERPRTRSPRASGCCRHQADAKDMLRTSLSRLPCS